MSLWTFLHVVSMFGMVTLIVSGELFIAWAIRRRDVEALRVFVRLQRIEILAVAFLLAGITFGVLAALTGGWDLLQGWLVAAYLLLGASVLLGAGVNGRYVRQVMAALPSEDSEPGPELEALFDSPQALIWPAVNALLIVAIIYLMVMKPTF